VSAPPLTAQRPGKRQALILNAPCSDEGSRLWVRALKEENARLREALRALEPPKRRPWWRFWG
jgi:hypothetical protein